MIARKIKPTIFRFSKKNSNKKLEKVPILLIPMLPSKNGE
jgi:hypothetical protein